MSMLLEVEGLHVTSTSSNTDGGRLITLATEGGRSVPRR